MCVCGERECQQEIIIKERIYKLETKELETQTKKKNSNFFGFWLLNNLLLVSLFLSSLLLLLLLPTPSWSFVIIIPNLFPTIRRSKQQRRPLLNDCSYDNQYKNKNRLMALFASSRRRRRRNNPNNDDDDDSESSSVHSNSNIIPQLPAIGASSFDYQQEEQQEGQQQQQEKTTTKTKTQCTTSSLSSESTTSTSRTNTAFVASKFQIQYTCKVCNTRNWYVNYQPLRYVLLPFALRYFKTCPRIWFCLFLVLLMVCLFVRLFVSLFALLTEST